MFLLIPLAIIFLAMAYLTVNENISVIEEAVVYSIIIGTIFLSMKLYKKVQKDITIQEINALKLEFNELKQKWNNTNDKEYKKRLDIEMEKIQKEINEKLS